VWLSEKENRINYRYSIDWLASVEDSQNSYCAVRTPFLEHSQIAKSDYSALTYLSFRLPIRLENSALTGRISMKFGT